MHQNSQTHVIHEYMFNFIILCLIWHKSKRAKQAITFTTTRIPDSILIAIHGKQRVIPNYTKKVIYCGTLNSRLQKFTMQL
jgi:hypothetical protein